jgi:hypothetical protein
MSRYNNHFSPGVHTAIEFPERVHWHRRLGWGLEVQQEADPPGRKNNWFHIGVPILMSDRIEAGVGIVKLYYSLALNENARLAEIHIRTGSHLAYQLDRNDIGRTVQETVDLYTAAVWVAPTVCFRIEFLSGEPMGHVTFYSAGLGVNIADDA